MRGEARDSVELPEAAPSGGLVLSVRRHPCSLRESLQFSKAGLELQVRESKYSFTLRRASDSAVKQPPSSAKRPRARTAADVSDSMLERKPARRGHTVYDELASSAPPHRQASLRRCLALTRCVLPLPFRSLCSQSRRSPGS